MLRRFRQRIPAIPPDPSSINYSAEHVAAKRAIARRRKLFSTLSARIPLLRIILASIGVLWILALPYEGLWKNTYMDEHAVQPAQVKMYYDWANVHKADRYLDVLETLVNSTIDVRSTYLQTAFAQAGLHTGNTSTSTHAHVTPPRSAGTETILLTANWISRDGGPNLRGIATLLSLGDFLRGQNHWAFDIVLVVGEGYIEGLNGFMQEYHSLFGGVIWTGLNIDYPGHSFSHVGIFYEGLNGRLPNQDLPNAIAHIARWAGGVSPRLHDIPDEPMTIYFGPDVFKRWLGDYLLGAKHLWEHFKFMAIGKASGAHGVLARHRIDSATIYCTPSTGPHGFHTLGRTLESSLRSLNNLLERLHASYFFYLLPKPGRFIPVGHYLPSAILLGASITIGGFDCPEPLQGVLYFLPPVFIAWIGWILQSPFVWIVASVLPRPPNGDAQKSFKALAHLLYGAMIPTLAMVNFPQAILLAGYTMVFLSPWGYTMLGISTAWFLPMRLDLRNEWEVLGNLAWPGVFAVLVPLWCISAML